MFDRVILINLKRRPDRLAAFDRLRSEKGWHLPEPTIVDAIDGNKVGVPEYYIAGGGAWGCARSHVKILEQCMMDDVGSVLVLEDDVTWMSDTWDRLAEFMRIVPSDWDQLMLGGQHVRPAEQVVPGVSLCRNCQRTHAYAIRGRAMKDLLKLWYKCNTHIDHVMGPWQSSWRVYAPEPFLFGQSAGQSDISGARNPAKLWAAPSESAPVVHLTTSPEIVRQLRGYGLHTGHTRERETDYDLGLVAIAANPSHGLRKWLDTLLWEAASEEGCVVAVWHPSITAEIIRSVYSGRVVEVAGSTLEECVAQLPPEAKARDYPCHTRTILLRSSREVMESLRGHGWHSGNWRDDVTGQDNGLRRIAGMVGDERAVKLRAWVDYLANEATSIPGGVVCAWHPDITADELQAATARKVVEIVAASVGDAVQQFKEARGTQ